jgi:hypothetical protein
LKFFAVRNFEKFQHYHDRRPPWIKLYRDLWDDPRFFELQERERYILIGIFVLASQHENKVSASQSWLQAKLLTSKPIPLQRFIDTGWIEDVEQNASKSEDASGLSDSALAEGYPSHARGETETEVQRQNTETEKPADKPRLADLRRTPFTDYFHEEYKAVHGRTLLTDKSDFMAVEAMMKKTANDAAYSIKPLKEAAFRFIRSQDPFHLKQGHPLRYFANNVNAFMGEIQNGARQQNSIENQGATGSGTGTRSGPRPYTPRQC